MRRDYKPQKRPRPDDDKENEPPSHQAKKAAKGGHRIELHSLISNPYIIKGEKTVYPLDCASHAVVSSTKH